MDCTLESCRRFVNEIFIPEELKKFKESGKYPAALYVILKDGDTQIVNVDGLASTFGVPPGQVIEIMKPKIKEDKDVYATIFASETWFSTRSIDDPEKDKILNGDVRVSSLPDKKEMIMFLAECRDGFVSSQGYEFISGDSGIVISDKNMFETFGEKMEGRCMGIFK